MSFKDQILDAAKELASKGKGRLVVTPEEMVSKLFKVADAVRPAVEALGISLAWDDKNQLVVLSVGDVPAPAPVPEPEPVVEVDVEKLVEDDESEKYPKKWTFGDKR
jgi:hypothetical protein|tara:strand:- start:575 stop:895 length:321 start_codon:yes stop_codon:yes gene_type:complete